MSTATLPPNLRRRSVGLPPTQPTLQEATEPEPTPEPEQTAAPTPAPPAPTGRREAQLAGLLADLIGPELAGRIGTDADAREAIDALRQELADLRENLPTATSTAVRIEIGEPGAEPRIIEGARPELAHLARMATSLRPHLRNFALVGPTGSGKTTIAAGLAEALDLPLCVVAVHETLTQSALIGTPTAQQGGWNESGFATAYREGAVIVLEEADSASPGLVMGLNAATDAQMALFRPQHPDPDERRVARDPRTVILANMNTWAHGPDAAYVGRTRQDAATMNRFRFMEIGYSDEILAAILPDDDTRRTLDTIRETIRQNRIEQAISPRDYETASDLHAAGFTREEIIRTACARWSSQQREKLPAGIRSAFD